MSSIYEVTFNKSPSKKSRGKITVQADNRERAKSKAAKAFLAGKQIKPTSKSTDEILADVDAILNELEGVQM